MRRNLAILIVVFALGLRAAPPEERASLAPGQTADLTVDSLHPAGLVLNIGQNKASIIVVDQDEPSVQFRILSDDGTEIRAASAGFAGIFVISLPPSRFASVHLVATPQAALRTPAMIAISLEPSGLIKSDLPAQREAEQIFLQAQLLRRELSANSLRRAIALIRRARLRWREGHSRLGEAIALASEGEVEFQLSNYAGALRHYSLARQLAGPNSSVTAFVLNAEAVLDLELWKRERALEAATSALAISRKLDETRGEAGSLANIGIAKWLLSRADAEASLTEALEMARSGGNRIAEARVLSVQAWMKRDFGRPSEAIELMEQSAQLFQETGRTADAAGEMLDIALTDKLRGDPYAATVRHARLIKLFREVGSVYHEAIAASGLGQDYLDLNRPRDALPYFREARRLFASTGNLWDAQTALGLTCDTEIALGLYRAAQLDCEESRKTVAEFHARPSLARADLRLGEVAEARGQRTAADEYYRRAAKLSSDAGYTMGEASAALRLGHLRYSRTNASAAMELFKEALSLSQKADDPSGIIEAKYQIARLYADDGHFEDAQTQLDDATALSESERAKIRSDKLRSSYFALVRKCYDLYVDILMRRSEADPVRGFDRKALDKSEAARARTLFEALGVNTASSGRPSVNGADLTRLRAALNEKYEERLNLIVVGRSQRDLESNAEEIRRLNAEYDQALAIDGDGPAPAPTLAPLAAAEVIRASSDAVVLEYHIAENRSYLWKVERGEIASFTLPARKNIDGAVEKWRDLASARQRHPDESFAAYRARVEVADRELPLQAAKLSCMLLAGLKFQKGAKLVIIADGSLQALPFAALPSNGCQGPGTPPLLVLHEVRNVFSLRILTAAQISSAPVSKKDIAILADPVFSIHDDRVAKSSSQVSSRSPLPLEVALRDAGFGSELPRLYATREEAKAIAALAPGSVLLALDFQASLETSLSAELSNYRVWHFATHGLLDRESPDLSGLVFSLVDSQGRSIPGYLKIQDIFDLSIDPDLVVLSACESGLGEQVDGEGAVGMSYAFLHAGAKQVISTLWKVDDTASSALMKEFYRGLLVDRLSPASSLRKAQIAILNGKSKSQPFYWAAYLLMSN